MVHRRYTHRGTHREVYPGGYIPREVYQGGYTPREVYQAMYPGRCTRLCTQGGIPRVVYRAMYTFLVYRAMYTPPGIPLPIHSWVYHHHTPHPVQHGYVISVLRVPAVRALGSTFRIVRVLRRIEVSILPRV